MRGSAASALLAQLGDILPREAGRAPDGRRAEFALPVFGQPIGVGERFADLAHEVIPGAVVSGPRSGNARKAFRWLHGDHHGTSDSANQRCEPSLRTHLTVSPCLTSVVNVREASSHRGPEMTTTEQPTRCLRCGRQLRAPRSVSAQYGPGCRARIRAAAIAQAVRDFTAAQVEKARELIADGGLVPTRRPGVFRAVSSDGQRTYLTHSNTCGCPWGLRGKAKACAHSLGVRIVLASGKAA